MSHDKPFMFGDVIQIEVVVGISYALCRDYARKQTAAEQAASNPSKTGWIRFVHGNWSYGFLVCMRFQAPQQVQVTTLNAPYSARPGSSLELELPRL